MQLRRLRRRMRHRVALAAFAVGTVSIGGAAMALPNTTPPSGLSGALSGAPANIQRDAAMTPQERMRCPALQCDAQALQERRASFGPAQPIDPGKPFLAEDEALSETRHRADVPSEQQDALPAKAVMMTMAEANARLNTVADPLIAPDRPVWVVTVHGNRDVHGPPGVESQKDVFTNVYDAPTGQIILEAIGVDALGSGN